MRRALEASYEYVVNFFQSSEPKKSKMSKAVLHKILFSEDPQDYRWENKKPYNLSLVAVTRRHADNSFTIDPTQYHSRVITIGTNSLQHLGLKLGDRCLLPVYVYRFLRNEPFELEQDEFDFKLPLIHIQMNKYAQLDQQIQDYTNLFHLACHFGDRDIVSAAIDHEFAGLNKPLQLNGLTPAMILLRTFAHDNLVPIWVYQFIKNLSYKDLIFQDGENCTLMHHALAKCPSIAQTILKLLMESPEGLRFEFLSYVDNQNYDIMCAAIFYGQLEIAKSIFYSLPLTLRMQQYRDIQLLKDRQYPEHYINNLRQIMVEFAHDVNLITVMKKHYEWPEVPSIQKQKIVDPTKLKNGKKMGKNFEFQHITDQEISDGQIEFRTIWVINNHLKDWTDLQYGAFAKVEIKHNPSQPVILGDYVGDEVILLDSTVDSFMMEKISHDGREYSAPVYIDSSKKRNWTAFINNGINCNTQFIADKSDESIAVETIRTIPKDAQIIADYNTDLQGHFGDNYIYIHPTDDGLSPYELPKRNYYSNLVKISTSSLEYLGLKKDSICLLPLPIYQLLSGKKVTVPNHIRELYFPIIFVKKLKDQSDEFSFGEKINLFMLACHFNERALLFELIQRNAFDLNVAQYHSGLTGPMIYINRYRDLDSEPLLVVAMLKKMSYEELLQQDKNNWSLMHHALRAQSKLAEIIAKRLIALYNPEERFYLNIIDNEGLDIFRLSLIVGNHPIATLLFNASTAEQKAQILSELKNEFRSRLDDLAHEVSPFFNGVRLFLPTTEIKQITQSVIKLKQTNSTFFGRSLQSGSTRSGAIVVRDEEFANSKINTASPKRDRPCDARGSQSQTSSTIFQKKARVSGFEDLVLLSKQEYEQLK